MVVKITTENLIANIVCIVCAQLAIFEFKNKLNFLEIISCNGGGSLVWFFFKGCLLCVFVCVF